MPVRVMKKILLCIISAFLISTSLFAQSRPERHPDTSGPGWTDLFDSDLSNTIKPEDLYLPETTTIKDKNDIPLTFEEIEKQAIYNASKNNMGSVNKAAKELGLARQTLYNKMQKYGI